MKQPLGRRPLAPTQVDVLDKMLLGVLVVVSDRFGRDYDVVLTEATEILQSADKTISTLLGSPS